MAALLGREDRQLLRPGAGLIGVDEVGRGALAGPLVVAASRWTEIPENPWIRDSKKLGASRRRKEFFWIREHADEYRLVEIWPELIDRINILEATKFAMRRLVRSMTRPGDTVVVDAVKLGPGYEDVLSPVKADEHFFCVAAASILAKVHRDTVMTRLSVSFPHWAWEKNKGYGTVEHRQGIGRVGMSPMHRKSFRFSAVLP